LNSPGTSWSPPPPLTPAQGINFAALGKEARGERQAGYLDGSVEAGLVMKGTACGIVWEIREKKYLGVLVVDQWQVGNHAEFREENTGVTAGLGIYSRHSQVPCALASGTHRRDPVLSHGHLQYSADLW
jgi:hypothetical protein